MITHVQDQWFGAVTITVNRGGGSVAVTGGRLPETVLHRSPGPLRSRQYRAAVSCPTPPRRRPSKGLTRTVAVDHGPAGIRANAAALGSINTERYETLLDQQDSQVAERTREQMALLHPLGRVGQLQEVAATVAHLLSDDAGFITGAVVPVDGGRAKHEDPTPRRSEASAR